MRLIVTDANIFIDLDAGGLLEDIFRLASWEFAVPDVMYVEELADRYGRLPGIGLKVLPLGPDLVGQAVTFRERYPKPSLNDLFALALARAEQCPLLSGDANLGAAAKAEAVEVHGTLWLMDLLAAQLNIDHARIAAAYDRMRSDGRRLPWGEVTKQLNRLRGQAS